MQSKNYVTNKKFGYFLGSIFLMIWVYTSWQNHDVEINVTLFVGLIFLGIALVEPSIVKPLKTIWLNLGHIMGKIFNPVIMMVLYFLVITPVAIVARAVFSYDRLRKKQKSSQTYWITKQPITNYKEFFKNQF